MKVLGIFPAYEPAWAFGGVVRCTSNVFRAMARQGADVSVYTTDCNGRNGRLPVPKDRPVNTGGVEVSYLPATFGSRSVWHSRALACKLKATIDKFDVVYISAVWQWIGISAARIARDKGVPYVIGTHGSFDSILLKKSRVRKMLLWRLLLKDVLRGAAAIHFTSNHERRHSELVVGICRSFVVPNCIEDEAFGAEEFNAGRVRGHLGISAGASILLNVCRPDPKKKIDVLLYSFRRVLQSYPDAKLLIVGPHSGRFAMSMERLSEKLGIAHSVIWAGYREGAFLKGCYTAADLFVLPSIDENFGMAVAEAMAAGMPVVVSPFVGIADEVRRLDAGVVVDIDPEKMAHAAMELLADTPRRRSLGENAAKAARLYNSRSVAAQMLQAFGDLLSGVWHMELGWR
jgi:glycosyltransferase involved in cell wall biosynthesis